MKSLLALPHSSACAERIFLLLNIIKTKNRSLLKTDTINSLLYSKSLISEIDCTKWKPSEEMLKLMCAANLYEKEEATDESATFSDLKGK